MQKDLEDMKNFIKGSEIDEFIERYELRKFHLDFAERFLLFIIAALGLITALAWDETFKLLFVHYFGGIETLEEKALYALLLTILVALLTVRLNSIFKRRKKDKI